VLLCRPCLAVILEPDGVSQGWIIIPAIVEKVREARKKARSVSEAIIYSVMVSTPNREFA
jgi:hypothetical protein